MPYEEVDTRLVLGLFPCFYMDNPDKVFCWFQDLEFSKGESASLIIYVMCKFTLFLLKTK